MCTGKRYGFRSNSRSRKIAPMTFRGFLEKYRFAVLLGLALLFHIIGLVGIGFLHHEALLQTTPLHLLLMCALLLWSNRAGKPFRWWAGGTFVLGFVVEWVGINTGVLFGDYTYGAVLGPKMGGVPLIIGINWVIVLAGTCSLCDRPGVPSRQKIITAALLATAFDWLIEPVAVKLDYWTWDDGHIPFFNYASWAGVSLVIASGWYRLKLRANHFAVALLWIQAVFFAILRLVLL